MVVLRFVFNEVIAFLKLILFLAIALAIVVVGMVAGAAGFIKVAALIVLLVFIVELLFPRN